MSGKLKLQICDNTLREGEQSPGVAFTPEEKTRIAEMLDATGVDVIEAGFPATSSEERRAIRKITSLDLNADISGLCRAKDSDVDYAAECDLDWVSIFIATSDIHLRYKYGCSIQQAVDMAISALERAKEYGFRVRVAAEDATRSSRQNLELLYRSAEDAGADMISVADTLGILTPSASMELVRWVKNLTSLPVAVHFHNDLGMATANTLTAFESGALQLHTSVNGIGERAGNAPLEEILIALKLLYGVERYRTENLKQLSTLVEEYSGIRVAKNKPVVGENTFTHESGIHVSAILENTETYEPFPPEIAGMKRKFVFGKHTGRNAVRKILLARGVDIDDLTLEKVTMKVKELGEKKIPVSSDDLLEIVKKME